MQRMLGGHLHTANRTYFGRRVGGGRRGRPMMAYAHMTMSKVKYLNIKIQSVSTVPYHVHNSVMEDFGGKNSI